MPLRTIALITAFSPGQSPPPVRTPRRTGGTIVPVVRILCLTRARTALVCAASLALGGCLSREDPDERSGIAGDTVTV